MEKVIQIPETVYGAYAHLGAPASVSPITMGLINKTYLVTTTLYRYVLQEVAPIFDTTVNDDSDAVAHHLAARGIEVPSIYRTNEDSLFVACDRKIYRALKFIDGKSSHTITSSTMASSAGRCLGEFHRALVDFSYTYKNRRRHGGDYAFHRHNLVLALQEHSHHDYVLQVRDFAEILLKDLDRVVAGLNITPRHVHGDPKISNLMFDHHDQAICLVDFDTLGNSGWSLEMGDALRSWANPHKEDVPECGVDLSIAELALTGYGSIMKGLLERDEAFSIGTHAQAISLCLSIRYLTDVLNESYWAYDRERFSRPAEHNLLRARAMHNLFLDFYRKREILQSLLGDLLL